MDGGWQAGVKLSSVWLFVDVAVDESFVDSHNFGYIWWLLSWVYGFEDLVVALAAGVGMDVPRKGLVMGVVS